jgi:serine/threonine protein kinase
LDSRRPRVLITWKRYNENWLHEETKEELFDRVEAIADFLSSVDKNGALRVLPCLGFYDDPKEMGFGFAFELPEYSGGNGTPSISSLKVILDKGQQLGWPSLEDRYRLAYHIASCLLDIHRIGWLHKNISPSSIAFPCSIGSVSIPKINEPYLIGFNDSRLNDPKAFTEGTRLDEKQAIYQNPDYLKPGTRYCLRYDYYSLGIVLLEIGLWRPLTRELDSANWQQLSHTGKRDKIFKDRLPLLSHSMGSRYMGAVTACLMGKFDAPLETEQEDAKLALLLSFSKLVVEVLLECTI